jgi:hypothetical protein
VNWSIQRCVTDDTQRSFPGLQFDRELVFGDPKILPTRTLTRRGTGSEGQTNVQIVLRDLIRMMSRNNPLCGAPRIHGELRLGPPFSEPPHGGGQNADRERKSMRLSTKKREPKRHIAHPAVSSRGSRSLSRRSVVTRAPGIVLLFLSRRVRFPLPWSPHVFSTLCPQPTFQLSCRICNAPATLYEYGGPRPSLRHLANVVFGMPALTDTWMEVR